MNGPVRPRSITPRGINVLLPAQECPPPSIALSAHRSDHVPAVAARFVREGPIASAPDLFPPAGNTTCLTNCVDLSTFDFALGNSTCLCDLQVRFNGSGVGQTGGWVEDPQGSVTHGSHFQTGSDPARQRWLLTSSLHAFAEDSECRYGDGPGHGADERCAHRWGTRSQRGCPTLSLSCLLSLAAP
jgi:hypothetical protein